jgi:hypothetical protein
MRVASAQKIEKVLAESVGFGHEPEKHRTAEKFKARKSPGLPGASGE